MPFLAPLRIDVLTRPVGCDSAWSGDEMGKSFVGISVDEDRNRLTRLGKNAHNCA